MWCVWFKPDSWNKQLQLLKLSWRRGGRSNPFPFNFSINQSLKRVHLPNNTFDQSSCKSLVYKKAAEKVSLFEPQFKQLGRYSICSFFTKDYNCRVEYNTYFLNLDWACDSRRLVWHEQRTIFFLKKPVCYQYIILQSHAATHVRKGYPSQNLS